MKRIIALAALAAALAGCTVTKIEYEQGANGETSYRLYRNDHWLKTEAEGLAGGMSKDGTFDIRVEGMKQSPSEEFNHTMQTYTGAFIQLAQIAAAAYSPSAASAIAAQASSGGSAVAAQPAQGSAAAPSAASSAGE